MERQGGFQLADLVVALAIAGFGIALGVPALWQATSGLRVHLAAGEVVAALRQARSQAIRRNLEVAVRFSADARGHASFTLYRDGDGDGVLTADIRAGVDRPLGPPIQLEGVGSEVRFGLPSRPIRDPGDPRQFLDRLEDPIRFNNSDLASFGPLGTSTPGSVYLTDGRDHLAAVRVFGRTAKVRVLDYDFARATWQEH